MDRLDGLSEAVATALRSVPVDAKAQLELAVHLPGLDGPPARVAERLRLRVLTWDPLGWSVDREPGPVVTVEGGEGAYRITLFVGAWTLDAPRLGTVRAELAALADSIIRTGAEEEEALAGGNWLALERDGSVPPLLRKLALDAPEPLLDFELVTDWRPIDEETVAMVVSGGVGPVGIDLTPRPLSSRPKRLPGCGACAGDRYSVPFELDRARPKMCPAHQAEGLKVMIDAVKQGEKADPDSWNAFSYTADLLPAPHVPYSLRNRLLDPTVGLSEGRDNGDLLAEQADALMEFLAWAATSERFRSAMADLGWGPVDDLDDADRGFEDFALTVVYRLGAAGQFDTAARLADTLPAFLPHTAGVLHGQLAVHLAERGRIDEARVHLGHALAAPIRDPYTEVYAAEVDEKAGDLAAAEARYRSVLAESRTVDDGAVEFNTLCHLIEMLEGDADRADEVAKLREERDGIHAEHTREDGRPSAVGSARAGQPRRKVGRNEPCPCGSGRKFKRCHGAA